MVIASSIYVCVGFHLQRKHIIKKMYAIKSNIIILGFFPLKCKDSTSKTILMTALITLTLMDYRKNHYLLSPKDTNKNYYGTRRLFFFLQWELVNMLNNFLCNCFSKNLSIIIWKNGRLYKGSNAISFTWTNKIDMVSNNMCFSGSISYNKWMII